MTQFRFIVHIRFPSDFSNVEIRVPAELTVHKIYGLQCNQVFISIGEIEKDAKKLARWPVKYYSTLK